MLPPTPPAEPHMISRKQPWFREILRGSTAEVQLRSWVRRSRIQASPDGGLGEPGLKQQSGAGHADHVSRQPGLLQPVGGSKGFSDPGTRHPNLTRPRWASPRCRVPGEHQTGPGDRARCLPLRPGQLARRCLPLPRRSLHSWRPDAPTDPAERALVVEHHAALPGCPKELLGAS